MSEPSQGASRVARSRRLDFSNAVVSGVVSGIISGCILWAAATYLSNQYSDTLDTYLTRLHPTCDAPGDLTQVPAEEISAQGGGTGADAVIDGYFGSIWLPKTERDPATPHIPTFASDASNRSLTLVLATTEDIRLVCVNNGLGNSESNYQNWGRVRSVAVASGAQTEPARTTVLLSLPVAEMQRMQEAARDLGPIDNITIRAESAYGGMTIETFDPDHCGQDSDRLRLEDGETAQSRFVTGCIRAPVPRAGLSEVVLYARK